MCDEITTIDIDSAHSMAQLVFRIIQDRNLTLDDHHGVQTAIMVLNHVKERIEISDRFALHFNMLLGASVIYKVNDGDKREEVIIGGLGLDYSGEVGVRWNFIGKMARKGQNLKRLFDTIQLDCNGLVGMMVINSLTL